MSQSLPVNDPRQQPVTAEEHCQLGLTLRQQQLVGQPSPIDLHRDCRLCLMLLDSIPSSVLLLDQQLRIVSTNSKFLSRSRLTEIAVIGHRLEEVFPAVIYQNMDFRRRISDVFRSGEATAGERLTYRAPGLPIRTYYYTLVPFRCDGRVDNVMLLMEDITDMIRLSEEARKAERHLASVIESASDIVLSMRPAGQILTWNTAAVQVLGFEEHKVRDRSLCDLCVEPQRPILAQVLERVRARGLTERVELELVGRDGHEIPISWVFSAMRDADGRVVGLVAVGRDLTERRKFEAQLQQNEKLAALGVMAGGIAHELRNPLAVVSSAAQLLIEKPALPQEVATACVEKIFTGAQRMAGIIENLLSFARPSDKGRNTKLNLVPVIREAVTLMSLQPDFAKIDLQTKYPDGPVSVHGNACLLQQLVTNLVLNSLHATSEQTGRIAVLIEKTASQAMLYVSDTGCGIPLAHLNKVFDPFFTAMPQGRGTGLGLSICHSIVQQHEGKIEIASREGQGTTVKVTLPLLKEAKK